MPSLYTIVFKSANFSRNASRTRREKACREIKDSTPGDLVYTLCCSADLTSDINRGNSRANEENILPVAQVSTSHDKVHIRNKLRCTYLVPETSRMPVALRMLHATRPSLLQICKAWYIRDTASMIMARRNYDGIENLKSSEPVRHHGESEIIPSHAQPD